MKRLVLLFLALLLLLCSCTRTKPAETTEPTAETTAATVILVTTEPVETTTFEEVKVATPTIGPGVDVKYEVLTLDDAELDSVLEAHSADILKRYIPNISSITENGGTAEYDVKLSSIYKSEQIISAVFSGSYAIYYENSEEGGEVLYTVNIDPATGKMLETPDIVDYEKMVEAFRNGRFDVSPDFSPYNGAYGIYPYVSIETVEGEERLGIYVTKSGMYEEVLGYYVSPESASDFLKIQITAEE